MGAATLTLRGEPGVSKATSSAPAESYMTRFSADPARLWLHPPRAGLLLGNKMPVA